MDGQGRQRFPRRAVIRCAKAVEKKRLEFRGGHDFAFLCLVPRALDHVGCTVLAAAWAEASAPDPGGFFTVAPPVKR